MSSLGVRRRRRPMTELGRRIHYRNARTGGRSLGEAFSADGEWYYRHEEDRVTSWSVMHLPTGRCLSYFPSERAAREATFDGSALAELDRTQPVKQT